MMQLKTKLKSMITSWSSNFARNLHKNIFHLISQWFSSFCVSVFCQIIVTPNIHKTSRLKIIKIIFYQPPKLPSLITKKWWKFFCGDQLERIFISSCSDNLPSRTGFDRSQDSHLATDFEFNFNPPTEKSPNPRNDSSIFHSSPVQEQSTHTNPPKTHTKSNASLKKPSTRSSKNFNQNLAVSPKISAEKKLDSPGWLKGW